MILQQSTAGSLFPVHQLIVNSFIYSENPSLDSISILKTRFYLSLSFHCQSANWLLVPSNLSQRIHLYLLKHDMYFHLCASSIHSRKKWSSSIFSLVELTNYLFFSFIHNCSRMSLLVSTFIMNSSFPCIFHRKLLMQLILFKPIFNFTSYSDCFFLCLQTVSLLRAEGHELFSSVLFRTVPYKNWH